MSARQISELLSAIPTGRGPTTSAGAHDASWMTVHREYRKMVIGAYGQAPPTPEDLPDMTGLKLAAGDKTPSPPPPKKSSSAPYQLRSQLPGQGKAQRKQPKRSVASGEAVRDDFVRVCNGDFDRACYGLDSITKKLNQKEADLLDDVKALQADLFMMEKEEEEKST